MCADLDNDDRLAYGLAEFADMLGIHKNTLYRRIRAGAIQACKIGTRTIILKSAATAYLESLPAIGPK